MGRPQSRKKNRAKDKRHRKICKVKRFSKHKDQIYEDLQPQNIQKYENQPLDEDLPGLGQYYCIVCAEYLVNDKSLKDHQKSKLHKRKQQELKEKPYDLKEAELLNKYQLKFHHKQNSIFNKCQKIVKYFLKTKIFSQGSYNQKITKKDILNY